MEWQNGIDTCAHRATLDVKGKTIAVLGSGFNHIFPPKNIELYKEIIEKGGAIISEYPPETPQSSQNFLNRNRIVSGLALGIDTYAHLGNVQINMENSKSIGKTIAVLGCGIDELYPKQNKILAKQILKTGGCIISEYPNGTKPNKSNFPQRNRIISGLAESIIVVEAGERSGAIITANLALEQGKEIFAVPGDITKKQSIGTNKLIKDGAFVITEVNDILNNNV